MGLRVTGLRIKEGYEKELNAIISYIEPLIIENFEERIKKESLELTRKLFNYYHEQSMEMKKDLTIDYSDFFDKSIYNIKKRMLSQAFFDRPHRINTWELFLKEILMSAYYGFHEYDLKIVRTKKSKRWMIISPYFCDIGKLPEEVFKYVENYSAENQTDDVPSHFNSYEEKSLAIDEWYDADESRALHYKISVNLNIFKVLMSFSIQDMIVNSKIRYKIYQKHYLNKRDIHINDQIEEMFEMRDDQVFKKLFEEEKVEEVERLKPDFERMMNAWRFKR